VSPIRLITFGSVPPEWGGLLRGGVATFHATLVEAIHADPELPVELVAIVSTGSGQGTAPAPVRVLEPGQRREQFLESLFGELQPDVALLNHFLTGWGMSLPKVAPSLPLVGVAHSWHPITFADDPGVALERMQTAMDGLAALVVPSEHCLREGRALGLRYPEQTYVVRYPLPCAFAEPVNEEQSRAGVVFAGELIPRKNAAAVVQAAALVDDLTVTIVGEGGEQENLERMAAELGVAERVRFAGSLAPGELRSAMTHAEAFCLPSLSESFGIVYIEALACGTPVIGFAETLSEVGRATGIRFGIGLSRTTAEATAAAIEEVRAVRWDRAVLRRATLQAYSAHDVAREYANVLASVAHAAVV
jgi:glycosyltransferase involved in cell wall biosynthesis